MTDLYDILGLDKEATFAEVKAAHRRLVKQHHPDAGGDAEIFALVQQAFEVLHDPERRQRYDLDGTIGEDQTEKQMKAIVIKIVTTMIISAVTSEGVSLQHLDFKKEAHKAIDGKQAEFDAEEEKVKTFIARSQEFASRMAYTGEAGKPSLVHDIIAQQIREAEEKLEGFNHTRAVNTRLRAFFEDYDYDFTEQTSPTGPRWVFVQGSEAMGSTHSF